MFESSVEEIKNIGTMKTNQLKLLEHQLEQEKQEHTQLQKNFLIMQNRVRTNILSWLFQWATGVYKEVCPNLC